MAMTKREQEEVRQLKERLSILAALRWTDEVDPDIPIPDYNEGLTKGFMYVGERGYWPRVEKACSTTHFHSVGKDDETDTQRGVPLFSTKLLALKSLRHALELEFAKQLLAVDLKIAAEKGVSD